MNDYVCMMCNMLGDRNQIPYRIIDTKDDKIKFRGQLCEKCFNKLIASKYKKETNND